MKLILFFAVSYLLYIDRAVQGKGPTVLSVFFSIFVVAAVALVFLAVCFLLVCGRPSFLKRKEKKTVWEDREEAIHAPEEEEKPSAPAVSDATRIFTVPEEAKEKTAGDDATRVFERDEMTAALGEKKKHSSAGAFALEPLPEVLEEEVSPDVLEEYFVRHFLNQYGAVSRTVSQDTRTVTHHLVEKAVSLAGRDAPDVLTHIMVQEALQNGQRSYVMMPDDIVLAMVTRAFAEVAQGNKEDTRTILAYDALRVMPRMEAGQFRALSLLLLFHYSRNMDNVDSDAFAAYAERYVEPLLQGLPSEYSGYQQLEYLHCVSLENKDTSFGQVLRDSYPLIFSFRGCMKSELDSIRKDWPSGSIVPSLFNSYYKAAVIDDSLLEEYFDKYGIRSGRDQTLLNALIHSRPVAYDRREMAHILGKISPSLEELQEAWDGSLLRRSSLTLMGMYIAQMYIRERIGEEFDLSHWM